LNTNLLSTGNQNAVSNGIPLSTISISSLTTQNQPTNSSLNESALIEFEKELNSQSSSLVQLTKSTNQLTRNTISVAADRCFQLTLALQSISMKISQLFQCASNLLSAVNGPLQQRTTILDLESEWMKINLLNKNEKNLSQQKELANQIQNQVKEIISRLNSILNIHLNVGQQSIVNTSEVLMSLQSEIIESLSNQTFANGAIRFSSIES